MCYFIRGSLLGLWWSPEFSRELRRKAGYYSAILFFDNGSQIRLGRGVMFGQTGNSICSIRFIPSYVGTAWLLTFTY